MSIGQELQNALNKLEPTPPRNVEQYSLMLYVVDDMEARAKCEQKLWYGVPLSQENMSDTKWLKLPCPTCKFEHNFKRSLAITLNEEDTFYCVDGCTCG